MGGGRGGGTAEPAGGTRPLEGRLGNVSAALLIADGAAEGSAGDERVGAAAARLSRLFVDVLLVGGRAPRAAPGRVVPEPDAPAGPLRPLLAALEASHGERVLVLSAALADAVPSDLLLALTAFPDAPAVLPRGAGGAQPLCAVYHRETVLPAARRGLAEGLALGDWVSALEPRFLEGEVLRELLDGGPLPPG